MVDVATIKIWDEFVGAVRWIESEQLASFQYDDKFLGMKYDISPIKMPIRNGDIIYKFPELKKSKTDTVSTYKGLPGLLADSLPDRYGNRLINVWLAQRGRPQDSMNPVEQLCFIGSRGMGALEYEPSKFKKSKNTFSVEVESLVEIAQKMLSIRENFEVNFESEEQKAIEEILKIGTSAGGIRPKAVIAYNKKSGEVRSGQGKVPKGFQHWLIKLDGISDDKLSTSSGWGRVEYAYHLMAKDCNIEMMDCQLFEENGRAHFMTKRFDRDNQNVKHHVQTLCGIQHFDYNELYGFSYEQIFQTMRMLRLPYPAAEQMFRRMVFNVLATNYDDHTKNCSFRLKKGGKWELAPAYDVCYSFNPNNNWVNQHTLSINGKHKNIIASDLLKIANDNNIRKGEVIIGEIKNIVKNWDKYSETAKVLSNLKSTIKNNIVAFNFN